MLKISCVSARDLLIKKNNVQLVKFVLIGILNTVIHYMVFILCYRLLQINLLAATITGYCFGMVNSFWMNRSWTFQVAGHFSFSEFLRFVIVNLVALAVNSIVLLLLVGYCNLVAEISQIISITFSLLVNFIGNKCWTFNDK